VGTNLAAARALPFDEVDRLRAVRRYDELRAAPDGVFEHIARVAARVFDAPIASISIVDSDRVRFLATVGVEIDELRRDQALCALAILQDTPYIVTDAARDQRCADRSETLAAFDVRFYLGAPLRTPDGHNLGTLNVAAHRPRMVTPEAVETLTLLARLVADELERLLTARRVVEANDAELARLGAVTDHLQQALDSRIVIEQAKGMLAERHDEPVDVAFRRIRLFARSSQRRLHDVAAEVVARTLDL
jgi:GAF domain-containing protein